MDRLHSILECSNINELFNGTNYDPDDWVDLEKALLMLHFLMKEQSVKATEPPANAIHISASLSSIPDSFLGPIFGIDEDFIIIKVQRTHERRSKRLKNDQTPLITESLCKRS